MSAEKIAKNTAHMVEIVVPGAPSAPAPKPSFDSAADASGQRPRPYGRAACPALVNCFATIHKGQRLLAWVGKLAPLASELTNEGEPVAVQR